MTRAEIRRTRRVEYPVGLIDVLWKFGEAGRPADYACSEHGFQGIAGNRAVENLLRQELSRPAGLEFSSPKTD
jgi:hypothetical protein